MFDRCVSTRFGAVRMHVLLSVLCSRDPPLHPQPTASQQAADGGAAILSALPDTAYGDLEGSDSAWNLSEGNLIKLLKVSQLQLQYLRHELAERAEAARALEDESLALAAGLASMPRLSLGEVRGALGALGGEVRELGAGRLEAVLERVRGEERGAAKAAVAAAVAEARRRVEAVQ